MNTIDKWYSKNKNRIVYVFVFGFVYFLLNYLGSKFFDWLITNMNIAKSFSILNRALDIRISLFYIIIGLGITLIVMKVISKHNLRKNTLKILQAKYGHGGNWVDITNELNKKVENNELIILISNEIAGDPTPGTRKVASVYYSVNGKKDNKNINENEILKLP